MKKISFWIVIFICMADAALAVTQEGGLFYLPEDTTTQHKDSTVQKLSLIHISEPTRH